MTDSPRPPSDPLALVGVSLMGRYTLRARLASGGMSVVYRAEDERLKRPVCVKVFFGIDADQPDYRTHYEHFVQEAFALSQLSHPNTLRIYDFGYLPEPPKSPFYVSELLEGGTLLQRVKRDGPHSPEEMRGVLEPIVHALMEAHARGIIHRDIKPSNILFGAPGAGGAGAVVKLADFGIAKAEGPSLPHRAGDTIVTGGRISLFSPGWAAPEQMRAEPVSPQTDVFSLGVLLAFGVSAKKVFPDRVQHVAYSVRGGGQDVIDEALGALKLPESVLRVCERACRAEAAERPSTPLAFLELLKESISAKRAAKAPVSSTLSAVTAPAGQTVTARQREPAPPLGATVAGSPHGGTVFEVDRLEAGEVVAGGRRIRLVPTAGTLDIGGPNGPFEPRLRVTFLEGGQKGRLHLRGLSCFLSKEGGRPSSAVELERSGKVAMMSAARKELGTFEVVLGRLTSEGQVRFRLAEGELALPPGSVQRAALLHFGGERASWLVHTPTPKGEPR